MTTEELLSGVVTKEVEPGVFRVVNDGVRDLTSYQALVFPDAERSEMIANDVE